jgi:hypothetical protein
VVAWVALGRPVAAARSSDGGVEAQPRIDRAAAAWYDVLEVMAALWGIPQAVWTLISFRSSMEEIGTAYYHGLSVWGLIAWVNIDGDGPRVSLAPR